MQLSVEEFFWVSSITTVGLQFVNFWYLSKGNLKVVYPLSIIVYVLYIIIETILAFNSPDQMGIMIFNAVNIWGLAMSFRGLMRLKSENVRN